MDQLGESSSLTDDEKLRLAEMLDESSNNGSEASDFFQDLINDNEFLNVSNDNDDDDDDDDDEDDDNENIIEDNFTVEVSMNPTLGPDDDDDYEGAEEEEEEEEEEDDEDDKNVDTNVHTEGEFYMPEIGQSDEDDDDPYNIQPDLQKRMHDIDLKLEQLNNDHERTMQEFIKFQQDDSSLQKRLRDIDKDLKRLSSEATTICKKHGENSLLGNVLNDNNTASVGDEICKACQQEDLFTEKDDWPFMKERYNLQVEKIEDMLQQLTEINNRDIQLATQEEGKEAMERNEIINDSNILETKS